MLDYLWNDPIAIAMLDLLKSDRRAYMLTLLIVIEDGGTFYVGFSYIQFKGYTRSKCYVIFKYRSSLDAPGHTKVENQDYGEKLRAFFIIMGSYEGGKHRSQGSVLARKGVLHSQASLNNLSTLRSFQSTVLFLFFRCSFVH